MHVGLMLVESIVPCRIGLQSVFMRPNENEVVRCGLSGARKRQRSLDHIREAHCPFIGLLGTHRPAEHQFQPLDAVPLANPSLNSLLAGSLQGISSKRGLAARRSPEKSKQTNALRGNSLCTRTGNLFWPSSELNR